MYWPNLKSIAFPVPGIIGGTYIFLWGPSNSLVHFCGRMYRLATIYFVTDRCTDIDRQMTVSCQQHLILHAEIRSAKTNVEHKSKLEFISP